MTLAETYQQAVDALNALATAAKQARCPALWAEASQAAAILADAYAFDHEPDAGAEPVPEPERPMDADDDATPRETVTWPPS